MTNDPSLLSAPGGQASASGRSREESAQSLQSGTFSDGEYEPRPRLTALPGRLLREARSRSSMIWQSPYDGTVRRRTRPYDDVRFQDEIEQARHNADEDGSDFARLGGDDGGTMQTRTRESTFQSTTRGATSAGESNGVRVWYESFTSVDWIHDAVKEASRIRRIRALRGVRGTLANAWDRFQGWLIVVITGIITAYIAGWIVKSEAVLFDLKEGYCARDWRLAKRFCCPYAGQPDWDGGDTTPTLALQSLRKALAASGTHVLAGWGSPTAANPRWRGFEGDEACPGWILWADKLGLNGEQRWIAEYGFYIGIAILWASIASLLTVYLTSSELYTSKKDVRPATSRKAQDQEDSNGEATERSPLLGRRKSNNGTTYEATQSNISQSAQAERAKDALPARKVLYFGSGSGISEVKCILSGFVIHGYLGFWTLFTKSVGLTLSVASGLSLGKEGPFVHIASCVGNIVCRVFPKYETNESKRREVLSCACAAGVAVAFGAPVGGVLFSLEEVSYYFPAKVMFRSFVCAMVAAATLRLIDPFGTGKIVLFQVTYDRDWHWVELAFFILIGLFGGLYGAFFTRMNVLWSTKVRNKTFLARHPLFEVIIITAISVVVSFLNDYTKMSGPELIADLFAECHEHQSFDGLCVSQPSQIGPLLAAVGWTMVVKGVLTIVTFGIKLPAGIFIPTLAVGACFGRLVGLIVQYAQWTNKDATLFQWCPNDQSACIVPGIYAMVGAAAALSGVTRTTISLVVIMFELTGTLEYAVPVMLAVLVARTVADALEKKSIYDLVLDFSGLPYLDAKEEHIWSNVTILDAVDDDVETISLDESNSVASLRKKLQRLAVQSGNPDGGFPIVTSARPGLDVVASARRNVRLAGYISAQELEHGLDRLASNQPHADPSQQFCTFDYLPRPVNTLSSFRPNSTALDASVTSSGASYEGTGANSPYLDRSEIADQAMRNSTLLASMDVPHDLSIFVDRAPLTLTTSSPLELVHQLFVKLGVRYLVVLRPNGSFKGVIFKKRWLAFLHSLEEGEHE